MKIKILYRIKKLTKDVQDVWQLLGENPLYRALGLRINPYYGFYKTNSHEKARKNSLLRRTQTTKTVCFAFRGIHWIDFFIPVHLEIQRLYGDKYCVLYLSDLASILKNKTSDTLAFYNRVRTNLQKQGIAPESYFDAGELYLFDSELSADIILFSENMNHVRPNRALNRVYLPHYFVLKAKDRNTFSSIRSLDFNHIFVPSKGTYFYTEEQMRHNNKAVHIHHIGYPKFEFNSESEQLFSSGDTVIYAPSQERETIFAALEQGILRVFSSLTAINFLIKLHPSIEGYKSGIVNMFTSYEKKYSNIKLDKLTAIHQFADNSKLLVTDFGCVGAEYKLLTGKPVIYLTVSDKYHGGSDLEFRDKYATRVSIAQLQGAILKHLNSQCDDTPLQKMRDDTVFNYHRAAEVAARKINDILS